MLFLFIVADYARQGWQTIFKFSPTFQPHKFYVCRYYQRIESVTFYPAKLNHFNTLPAKDALKYICKTGEFIKNAFNNRIWELERNNVLNIGDLHFMIFCLFIVSNHGINTVLKITLSFFRRNVEREIEIMNQLKSGKLLQLFDAYDNGRNEMCLITE